MNFLNIATACGVLMIPSCAMQTNPLFPLTSKHAREDVRRMEENPVVLERPVVCLRGWMDAGPVAGEMDSRLMRCVGDDRFLEVGFFDTLSFPACRKKVVERVIQRFGGDENGTVEVDVVAHSMGGLVALYANLSEGVEGFSEDNTPQGPRLTVRRLITIGTPHQGAKLAFDWFPDSRVRDMAPDSQFLQALWSQRDSVDGSFPEIHPLVIRGDAIVGSSRCAPPGQQVHWLPLRVGVMSHMGAAVDIRVLAEVSRLLRGEKSWTY